MALSWRCIAEAPHWLLDICSLRLNVTVATIGMDSGFVASLT